MAGGRAASAANSTEAGNLPTPSWSWCEERTDWTPTSYYPTYRTNCTNQVRIWIKIIQRSIISTATAYMDHCKRAPLGVCELMCSHKWCRCSTRCVPHRRTPTSVHQEELRHDCAVIIYSYGVGALYIADEHTLVGFWR
jgi:hypothetical protein